jgi:hypothetical protein
VNEAWLEADRGIEEMRIEAEKERARVLDLHTQAYKELQVAKHDLTLAKEAAAAAERQLLAPPLGSAAELQQAQDGQRAAEEREATLRAELTAAEGERQQAEGRLAAAVAAEGDARAAKESAEAELSDLRQASGEALRTAEQELRALQAHCDHETQQALRGRLQAEARLHEASPGRPADPRPLTLTFMRGPGREISRGAPAGGRECRDGRWGGAGPGGGPD